MYTPEQVEDQAERVGIVSENCTLTRDMLRAYAATLKAAQGGVTEAFNWTEFWNRISQSFSSKCVDEVYACYEAGKRAALSAEPAAQGEAVALNVRHPKCHEAANAFWNYWNANGETHKRGYYESTWGAINAALRMVGVRPHDYGDAPPTLAKFTQEKP